MKPDAYMPFYFRDFWEATKGKSDQFIVAYLKAITHYWGHCHTEGLADDTESLRKICEVDKSDWDGLLPQIFDNDHFFCIGEDGKWHQKRAAVVWIEAKKVYDAAVTNGKKGGIASGKSRRKRHV